MSELPAEDGRDPGGPRGWWWQRIFRERPAATWVRESPYAGWIVVATVCAGAFMGQLDASIVSLALPPIQAEFGGNASSVEWVALSYLLTLVALVAPIGRVSDWLGRKSMYVYGFAVFTIASALCAIAPNLTVLILFRVVQAVGAAMLQANSVALIATNVPRNRLNKAIGIQGAAQAVGLALGPTVGGLLVAVGDWRLIFAVNIPFGIAGVIAGWFFLPRSKSLGTRTPMDRLGFALFVPSIVLGMLALSFVAHPAAETAWIVALAVACVVLALLFVAHARRTSDPIIDVSLFASRAFSVGIASGLLSYTALFGVLFAIPMALARTQSAATTGLILTTLPVMLAIIAPLAGYSAERWGARAVTTVGMLAAAAGLITVATSGRSVWGILAGLAVVGLGSGLFTPANNASIMVSAPLTRAGAASGTLNMTRGLGTALGVAAATIIVESVGGSEPSAALEPAMFIFAAVAVLAAGISFASPRPVGRAEAL